MMAKYEICIIQPKENEGFFTTTFWLEVITLRATGEFVISFKSQSFRNKNLSAWDSPGWRYPSEEYDHTQERIKSSLVAEGWHPVIMKRIDSEKRYKQTGEFFFRELSSTNSQEKTPSELLVILNTKIQQGAVEMDLGAFFRDALVYVLEKIASQAPEGVIEKLERLTALHRDGALTESEYKAAKRRLLEG